MSTRNCAALARITTQSLKSTSEINKDKTYELPDGNIIIDGAQRFHCVDMLFQPSLNGKEASGSTTLADEVCR